MGREEAGSRIIEDGTTGDNLAITSDGAIYNSSVISKWLSEGKIFVAGTSVTFSGTTFENKLLFRNPASSGKTGILLGINIHLNLNATTNQLNQLTAIFFKSPTVTSNGTSVNINNLNIGSSATPVSLITKEPTISSNGSEIGGATTINTSYGSRFPLLMPENTSVLARLKVNDSTNSALIAMSWIEI